MGHAENCRCKRTTTRERSKGPKRLTEKRDSRCESAFTRDDDKLQSASAESSIAGACCSSSSSSSQIKRRCCKGNSGLPSNCAGKERRPTHCPATPSPGHCRFSESSSCKAKKKNVVAESCCGNCCDTRESEPTSACCSNSRAIKCGKKADACTGTASPKCADPCKRRKKKKYKRIWKNFKSVWSRKTRRQIAIERSFKRVVRDQSVNTCGSNVSLDYQYDFTECKMVTGILKHEKIASENSFSDVGCCTSSSEELPNDSTKSQESIRSNGRDESVVTSKPAPEENKKAAAESQETKPSGGLFKKFGRRSSKDKNSDKDVKTPNSKNKTTTDKSPRKEQNTKVTIKETSSQSKSLGTKNPSQAANKGVGTNDVEREKSKQNIDAKEVPDGCQPKSRVMESKDFVICQCSKGSKKKIKHSCCGQDSCS